MTVHVRRATLQDAAAFARVMSDPAVYPALMQLPFTDEGVWRERLTESLRADKMDLCLVAERESEVVGTAHLHPAGPALRRRHVMAIGMAVAVPAQRTGVGRALLTELCDYADRWLGILRLELQVYTDNAAAIALYRQFGFEIEGTHRGFALRDGVYVDSHSMARWHPNAPRPSSP